MYFSDSLASLQSEVPATLLPVYLGGSRDESLYHCITTARLLESHFSDNIKHAEYERERERCLGNIIYCYNSRLIYKRNIEQN